MGKNDNFFKSQRISSRIKASIVSTYFPQYCSIIQTKHMPKKIGYFDLFAGPGKYEDGNPSTPLLVARECMKLSWLKNRVWMVFNDKEYSDTLKHNFEEEFPQGTFPNKPHFGHSVVGENADIDSFIMSSRMEGRYNECPSLMFIDPFGYKSIKTVVLAEFMKDWGNELFIFVNTKRINPALENEKFESLMKSLFPSSFNRLKNEIRNCNSLPKRLQLILDNLGKEFEILLGQRLYYTAFRFQEEDVETTSHNILHITKSKRGYDLIKQIYTDFANVGTIFDGGNTYTFDPKKVDNSVEDLFDTKSENIDVLKDILYSQYRGRELSALELFEEHQIKSLYSRSHYVQALRRLVEEQKVEACFIDDKQHKVTVLLIKECKLKFK